MEIRVKSFLKVLFIGVLFASLSACQAAVTPEDQDKKGESSPVVSPTAPLPTLSTAVPQETTLPQPTKLRGSGITGQVISASDVAGQPDTPLANQIVVAVPRDRAGQILGVREEQLNENDLRFLKANLSQADPGISVTLSGADGTYTLPLDPGEYILCVADSEKNPPDFPAVTRGCGQVNVQEGQIRRVEISSGFGEILLVDKTR
jgi:hypothetical protein